MNAPNIKVVLTRTLYESNVGASSRAMANMGAHELILIDPKCEFGMAAQKAAASAQEALQNRKIYPSWDAFYQEHSEGIRIALTARAGKGRAARDLQETLRFVKHEITESQSDDNTLYFIFGPEDWGLSAEDLELVHYSCTLPTYGENSSLNLAQAVLLTLFIFRDIFGGTRTAPIKRLPPQKTAEPAQLFPDETLKEWLEEMRFQTDGHGQNVHMVMRRMLLQNVPTKKELRILETVLQQGIRKLKEYNEYLKRHGPLGKIQSQVSSVDQSKQEDEL